MINNFSEEERWPDGKHMKSHTWRTKMYPNGRSFKAENLNGDSNNNKMVSGTAYLKNNVTRRWIKKKKDISMDKCKSFSFAKDETWI